MSSARSAMWGVGLHLRRAAPALLLAPAVVVLANLAVGPVRPRAPRTSRFVATSEPWRAWRDRLDAAHRARRAGDESGALRLYDRVGRAVRARVVDTNIALYWHARMRLERGERSAVTALGDLLERTRDPALIARIGRAAARAQLAFDSSDVVHTLTSLVCRARDELRVMSRVQTEEGRRAKRWSDSFERSTAPVFFR